jgi:hypothetical protein
MTIKMSRYGVTVDVFGLIIGFIDVLQIITTCIYRAMANSRTLQYTTARIRFSQ